MLLIGMASRTTVIGIGSAMPDAADTQPYFASARTPEAFDHVVLVHLHAGYRRVVHRHDAVASLNAGFGTGTSRDDVLYDDRVGGHVERHAYAVELSFYRFVGPGQFRGGKIHRVGIQLFEQHGNDVFGDRVDRDGIDVLVVDERQQHVDLFAAGRHDARAFDDSPFAGPENQSAEQNARH